MRSLPTRAVLPTYMLLTLSVIALMASGSAGGMDLWVNSTADTYDGDCDAHCSIRDALVVANFTTGADVIHLQAATYLLTQGHGDDNGQIGDLDVLENLEIVGHGPESTAIDASGLYLGDRVFHVIPGAEHVTLTLTGLSVRGGQGGSSGGGGIFVDGRDLVSGTPAVVLSNVTVEGNQATCASTMDGWCSGGGIFAIDGSVVVEDGSRIVGNSATNYGGGISSVNQVANSGTTVTVYHSTIEGNSAGGWGGGGVALYDAGGWFYASTVSANTSACTETPCGGAGIAVWGRIDMSGLIPWSVTVYTSTVAGNSSLNGNGAGALSFDVIPGVNAWLALSELTAAGNQGTTSLEIPDTGQLSIANSVIAGSCSIGAAAEVVSSGGNLESPGNTCGLDQPTDHRGVGDPALGPLGHWGGPTETMLPLPGSPLIDSGVDFTPHLDQRGYERTDGLNDIGAVERRPEDQGMLFADGFEAGDTWAWGPG